MTFSGGKQKLVRHPVALGGDQVEGHHAVHQLLSVGRRRVQRLWVAAPHPLSPQLARIVDEAAARGTPVQFKSAAALGAAARTGAPQGVIAWAEPVAAVALEELLAPPGAAPFILVLDGVTDPGNFGALLRSAACAGVSGVVIGRHRSAALTPAAVKAAAGAVEVLAIAQVPGVPASLAQLSQHGVWTVGLDPTAKDDLWRAPLLDGPVALVLGSEGSGLSRLARQRCELLVRVPQTGPLGSLNVAAAGAVACFEVARRRTGASQPIGTGAGVPL